MSDGDALNSYTLWRGGVRLGRFVERQPVTHHGRRVGAAGILEPSDAFAGVGAVMQTRVRIFPGDPVFQDSLPPEVIGAHAPPADGSRSRNVVALRPLSAEEARGISPDRILEIRDSDGNVVDADTVVLQLMIVADDIDIATVYGASGMAGESREIWHISFARHDDAT